MTRTRVKCWALVTGILAAGAAAAQAQGANDANGSSSKSAAGVTVVYDGDGFSSLAGGVRRGEVYQGTLNVEL